MDRDGQFTQALPIGFAGQPWTLQFSSSTRSASWWATWLALAGGLTIAGLLFGLARSLVRTRTVAQALAAKLTAELRDSEESYRRRFRDNCAPMLIVDPADGRVLEANDMAAQFYGHSVDKLRALTLAEISEGHENSPLAARDAGRGARFECQHRLADGTLRDVEVFASPGAFAGRPLVDLIVIDVSERKRAEAARQEMAQQLSYAMEAAGDGIWDWEIQTNCVKHNARWCRILGLDDGHLEHPVAVFESKIHQPG